MANTQVPLASSIVLLLISAAFGELLDRKTAVVVLVLGLIVLLGPTIFEQLRSVFGRVRLRFFPPNPAQAAIALTPGILQTRPVGLGTAIATVSVDAFDSHQRRMGDVRVILMIDNGFFLENGLRVLDAMTASTTKEGTSAGRLSAQISVAEPQGRPGVVRITAVLPRRGDSIILQCSATVIGPPSATGMTLTLTPNDMICGEAILATVTIVDAVGWPVGDGTIVYFVMDEQQVEFKPHDSARLSAVTKGGEASVILQSPPKGPGVHTVSAYTVHPDVNGQYRPEVLISKTFVCDLPSNSPS